jgi:hypothetical protein
MHCLKVMIIVYIKMIIKQYSYSFKNPASRVTERTAVTAVTDC